MREDVDLLQSPLCNNLFEGLPKKIATPDMEAWPAMVIMFTVLYILGYGYRKIVHFCKNGKTKLQFKRFIDSKYGVFGICVVRKGFEAYLHRHLEVETYYFMYGTGKLQIGDDVMKVRWPCIKQIPSNAYHAMTPISDFVILLYSFPCGPMQSVKYHYLNTKL